MSSVLITGAGGFVGGALAARLAKDGNTVVGVFRDVMQSEMPPTVAHAAYGNVTDSDFILRLLIDYEVTTVFHLAAQSIVKRAEKNPLGTYIDNALGTVSVLDACREYGEKNLDAVVVGTTDKVYGDGPVPYREDQPLRGLGPYSTSKVMADFAALDYARTYKLPVRVVRSCNVFGPGDLDESRLIPGTVARLLRGEPAIIYQHAWGMRREFVYIDDEVQAYRAVAEFGADGEAYNVSGSGPVFVAEVIRHLAEQISGAWYTLKSDIREIPEQYMDGSKLISLGWSPKVDLWDGLYRTVEWHEARKGIPQLAEVEP